MQSTFARHCYHDEHMPGGSLNNYILIVFDSCRYDSLLAARPKTIRRLGKVEKRWSYASWTAPSHFNLLMGLMPHVSPRHVFASEYYKKDFLKFNERLGSAEIQFKSFVPRLSLPLLLQRMGYRTHAMVSLPVLNPTTILNCGFDEYRLMDRHNDMRAMVKLMRFSPKQPSFYLLNVGETHYPYALPDEPETTARSCSATRQNWQSGARSRWNPPSRSSPRSARRTVPGRTSSCITWCMKGCAAVTATGTHSSRDR